MMRHALFILLSLVIVTGCDDARKRLPDSAGGPDEVLVVMSKGHWESEPGAHVRAILEQPMQGLPQQEALFRVAQCRPEDFASMLQSHHSVLYAAFGEDSSGFRLLRDQHARGQLVVRVGASTPEAWNALWDANADEAINAFSDHHRARIGARLKRERDAALASSLHASLGIELDVPGGYRLMKQDSVITWLQRDRIVAGGGLEHNVIEGVLIHRHPYISSSAWTVPYLVDLRDAATRNRVDGPDPGSYMVVRRSFEQLDLMPIGRAVQLDGRFAYLMSGLYGMHGAKMGGPFVSLSTLDPSGGTIVTVEGFAYAPQFDKRPYVRELEALIFSLRFSNMGIVAPAQ
ncbi:MAG TPA: DUF4837 family protein [Flavobacteriales bacterium]|nr:DUF4837 family protein [Flavobacteriales bacterium]HRD51051.1 DUF4837 family protein [Flavobacteriales bacterium]